MKKLIKSFLILLVCLFAFTTLSACSSNFSIQLGYKEMTMYVGETIKLTTNANELVESGSVVWTSDNESVATITEDGDLKALCVGYAYITAKYNNHTSKIFLNVLSASKLNRTLKLSGTQMVLIGESIDLTADVSLEEDETVIYESSNESVATVSNTGRVTGLLTGLTTIKAYVNKDESVCDEITILVRTGTGVQDVIYNYIYNNSYELIGTINLELLSEKVTSVVEKRAQAIVGVSNYKQGTKALSLNSIGSGVIYLKEATKTGFKYTLLTNNHVVEDNTAIKVYIGNEIDKEYDANVLKADEERDLAIVTFECDLDILPVTLDFDVVVNTGDFVIAIGNPNSYSYYNSVTFGIASFTNRELSGEKDTYVQHDAAISPGNSGGALLDINGNLIGINTLKIVKSTVEGMGFAIDLASIKAFLN